MPHIQNEDQETRPWWLTVSIFHTIAVTLLGLHLCLSVLSAAIISRSTDSWAMALGVFILSFGLPLVIFPPMRYIDKRKPLKAIPMICGEFVNGLVDGWVLIPFKGMLLLDLDIQTGLNFSVRFEPKEMVPGDRTLLSVPITMYGKIDPQSPLPVIEMGGIDECENRLKEQGDQRVRDWITSKEEGPQDMDQARAMRDDAAFAILEKLAAEDFRQIHPLIPNAALFAFKKRPPITATEIELKQEFDKLPQEEQNKLFEEVDAWLTMIDDLRGGRGCYRITRLGVILTGINIGNIEPVGESAEAAMKVNLARRDAEVQEINAKSIADEAARYGDVLGPMADKTNTVELVLVRRKLANENINKNTFSFPDVGPLAAPIVAAIAGKIAGGKDASNAGSTNGGK